MKASNLFVRALEHEGVEYIFGMPGEENLDMLESLRNSSIKLVVTRHEQAAGFMAATYGRLTGKPGVALSTLGPGATNLLTSTAYAQLGAMPVVFITGQKALGNRRQAAFQLIDVVHMMRPVTKFTEQLTHASSIPYKVREAFRIAQHETPGATHLEFPEDVANEYVPNARVIEELSTAGIGFAPKEAIDRVANKIKAAKHPLIMLGANAKRDANLVPIKRFIEETKIPFFSTQMGKGVMNEYSSCYLGTAALTDGEPVHKAIKAADLILNIGHDIVEKPPFVTDKESCDVIHLNYYPANIVEVYQPQLELIGDIGYGVSCLADLLKGNDWDFSAFDTAFEQQRTEIWQAEKSNAYPVDPESLVTEVQQVMPDDSILTLDNGLYKIWFARCYRATHAHSILLDNALASMGAGLPSGMAAQLLNPDKKVMAICGDGGFMMNSAEMETAVRLKLNLTVLVLNDKALGMIKWKQEDMGFDDYGLDLPNPDFIKYAESYGAKGLRVESFEDLKPKLEEAISYEGVSLLEVPINYQQNSKI